MGKWTVGTAAPGHAFYARLSPASLTALTTTGKTYKVSFDFYRPAGTANIAVRGFLYTNAELLPVDITDIPTNVWNSYSGYFSADADWSGNGLAPHIYSATVAGENFYIDNVQVTRAETLKFQLAASADNIVWTDFVGPDGTTATYFTTSGTDMPSTGFDTKRYIKYKAYLSTADTSYTPSLNDVSVSFTDDNAADSVISDVSDNPFYHYRGRGLKLLPAWIRFPAMPGQWVMWISPLSLPILCPETERL